MTSTSGTHSPPWLWPNLLGLDAPAVAVTWQILFARSFGADIPPVLHLILGLSVWCIYLADRLYDSIRTGETAGGTGRMMFTRRHFKPLAATLFATTVLNCTLIIRYIPENLMITGFITASLLGAYYMIRLKSGLRIAALIPREILCGMIFALGCVITAQAYALPGTDDLQFWVPAFFLGLVCSANCILISIWEREEDLAANDRSITTGSPRIVRHIGSAILVVGACSLALASSGPGFIYLAMALSSFAQRIVLHYESRMGKPMLRVLGDAVLLTPLLFMPFA
jgi:hypothetical protein